MAQRTSSRADTLRKRDQKKKRADVGLFWMVHLGLGTSDERDAAAQFTFTRHAAALFFLLSIFFSLFLRASISFSYSSTTSYF